MSQEEPKHGKEHPGFPRAAGSTVQLDVAGALEGVQLLDPTPGAPVPAIAPGSRRTPPPLPRVPSVRPSAGVSRPPAAASKRSAAKTVAVFVVLAAVFAAAGLVVGSWARSRKTPPLPATTAEPSGGVLVLPPVEMKSP